MGIKPGTIRELDFIGGTDFKEGHRDIGGEFDNPWLANYEGWGG